MSDNADMNATVAQVIADQPGAGVEEPQREALANRGAPNAPDGALSQEKANQLIGQARMDGRTAGVKELLAELGVENIDALKAIKQAQDEAAAANQTELEKAQKLADEAAKRAEAAESENARIKREMGFRDAWAAEGKPAENLAAALKLVDWPDGDADYADLVKQTVAAYPVLDPEPAKPDTGSAVGRRSAPAGPNPNHERWGSMMRIPPANGV